MAHGRGTGSDVQEQERGARGRGTHTSPGSPGGRDVHVAGAARPSAECQEQATVKAENFLCLCPNQGLPVLPCIHWACGGGCLGILTRALEGSQDSRRGPRERGPGGGALGGGFRRWGPRGGVLGLPHARGAPLALPPRPRGPAKPCAWWISCPLSPRISSGTVTLLPGRQRFPEIGSIRHGPSRPTCEGLQGWHRAGGPLPHAHGSRVPKPFCLLPLFHLSSGRTTCPGTQGGAPFPRGSSRPSYLFLNLFGTRQESQLMEPSRRLTLCP